MAVLMAKSKKSTAKNKWFKVISFMENLMVESDTKLPKTPTKMHE